MLAIHKRDFNALLFLVGKGAMAVIMLKDDPGGVIDYRVHLLLDIIGIRVFDGPKVADVFL
jgi:hypothetical protein